MRHYSNCVSEYEYKRVRDQGYRSSENSRKNHQQWLDLRKLLREYSKESGHEFPPEIKKAIGLR
jgi:hypothetical protein